MVQTSFDLPPNIQFSDDGLNTLFQITMASTELDNSFACLKITHDDGSAEKNTEIVITGPEIEEYFRNNANSLVYKKLINSFPRPSQADLTVQENFVDGTFAHFTTPAGSKTFRLTIAVKPDTPILSKSLTTPTIIINNNTVNVSTKLNVLLPVRNGGAPLTKITHYYSLYGTNVFDSETINLSADEITKGMHEWNFSETGLPLDKMIRAYVSVENEAFLESNISNVVSFLTNDKPAAPTISNAISQLYDTAGNPMISFDLDSDDDRWSFATVFVRKSVETTWKVSDIANKTRISFFGSNQPGKVIPKTKLDIKQFGSASLDAYGAYAIAVVLHQSQITNSATYTVAEFDANTLSPGQSPHSNVKYAVPGKGPSINSVPRIETDQNNTITVGINNVLNVSFNIVNAFNGDSLTRLVLSLFKNGIKIVETLVAANTSNYTFTVPSGQWTNQDSFSIQGAYFQLLDAGVIQYCESPAPTSYTVNGVAYPPSSTIYTSSVFTFMPTLTPNSIPIPANVSLTKVTDIYNIGLLISNETPNTSVTITGVEYELATANDFTSKISLDATGIVTLTSIVTGNNPPEYKALFKYNANVKAPLSPNVLYFARMRFVSRSNNQDIKGAWATASVLISDTVFRPPAQNLFLKQLANNQNGGSLFATFKNPDRNLIPTGTRIANYSMALKTQSGAILNTQSIPYVPDYVSATNLVTKYLYTTTMSINSAHLDTILQVELVPSYIDNANSTVSQGEIAYDTVTMNKSQVINSMVMTVDVTDKTKINIKASVSSGVLPNSDLTVAVIVPHANGISEDLTYNASSGYWEGQVTSVPGIDYAVVQAYVVASSHATTNFLGYP